MSARVINLRTARKRKAREAARRDADASAAKHGRNKAEKVTEEDARARLDAHLDGVKRDSSDDDG